MFLPVFFKFSNMGLPAQGRVGTFSKILDIIGLIYGFRAKFYSNKLINHFSWRMEDNIVYLRMSATGRSYTQNF